MSLDTEKLGKRSHQTLGTVLPPAVMTRLDGLVTRFRAASPRTRYSVLGGSAWAVVLLLVVGGSGDNPGGVTYTVQRGDLNITVLEGGALEALSSQEIRSGVKGREGAKILSIVEEGYRVTPEDVAAGKILVELDTASLVE